MFVVPLSSESDQFKDELNSDKSDREIEQDEWEKSDESDSDTSERQEDSYADLEHDTLRETLYMEQSHEELGEVCVCLCVCVYQCFCVTCVDGNCLFISAVCLCVLIIICVDEMSLFL